MNDKMASHKQIVFANHIGRALHKEPPDSLSAKDYFIFIRDNIDAYRRFLLRAKLDRQIKEQKQKINSSVKDENIYAISGELGVDIFDAGIFPWGNS